jgi:hypothetical protein
MLLYVSSFCNIKSFHYKYELSSPETEILTIISIKENGLTMKRNMIIRNDVLAMGAPSSGILSDFFYNT